jgi:hypothetical protein
VCTRVRCAADLSPAGGTKQEVFEQIVRFTLASDYAAIKQSIGDFLPSKCRNF